MTIVHIVGTRPQLIKLVVVHQALERLGIGRQVIIDTGQHFDAAMSTAFFDELGIPRPDHNLNIHSLPHGAMIGRTLESLEPLLAGNRPDQVVVYGDTNATIAGALISARLMLPLAHVEAGLRSFDRRGPEEQNRIVADHLSDRLYAPTPLATANLAHEGLGADRVLQTGDVMYDCALRFGRRAESHSGILARLGIQAGGFALCTAHRAETTDDAGQLSHLFHELSRLSRQLPVVMPLHPRTRARLDALGPGPWQAGPASGLLLIDPVGYLDMTRLETAAAIILTDSGGVQREAFFHGVPAIVFRPHSEWVELLDSGWSKLAPLAEAPDLVRLALERIGSRGTRVDAYGNGTAAESIAADLLANASTETR